MENKKDLTKKKTTSDEWGGKRRHAGRTKELPEGAKPTSFNLTYKERLEVKDFIAKMRDDVKRKGWRPFEERDFLFGVRGKYNEGNSTLNKIDFYSGEMIIPDIEIICDIYSRITQELVLIQLFQDKHSSSRIEKLFEIAKNVGFKNAISDYENIMRKAMKEAKPEDDVEEVIKRNLSEEYSKHYKLINGVSSFVKKEIEKSFYAKDNVVTETPSNLKDTIFEILRKHKEVPNKDDSENLSKMMHELLINKNNTADDN